MSKTIQYYLQAQKTKNNFTQMADNIVAECKNGISWELFPFGDDLCKQTLRLHQYCSRDQIFRPKKKTFDCLQTMPCLYGLCFNDLVFRLGWKTKFVKAFFNLVC